MQPDKIGQEVVCFCGLRQTVHGLLKRGVTLQFVQIVVAVTNQPFPLAVGVQFGVKLGPVDR